MKRSLILGIPVDNRNMEETVDAVMSAITRHTPETPAKYVATVNVDFLRNSFGWNPGTIRHPELLRVLRHADFVTPDGMPIVWLGRLLGLPLKERVAGADLVDQLAKAAAEKGSSIYFLGGRDHLGDQAAATLKNRYPKLKIAGVANPRIAMCGEKLTGAYESDKAIVEAINQSGAGLLFISLGNPKQEIWFNRVQSMLNVPVSIGIGGSYEFIVGSVQRAPKWVQRCGGEWIFRLAQEPGRLWQRYVGDLFQFLYMAFPVLALRLIQAIGREKEAPQQEEQDGTISLKGVSIAAQERLSRCVDRWKEFHSTGKACHFVDVSNKSLRIARLHRFSDVIHGEQRTDANKTGAPFLWNDEGHLLTLSIHEELNGQLACTLDTELKSVQWQGKTVTLDLENCPGTTTHGIGWVLNFKKHLADNSGHLKMANLSKLIEREFEVATVD